LTLGEVAAAFVEMDSSAQAGFFSIIAQHVNKWKCGMGSFAMQLQYVTESTHLSDGGREVMRAIGEYCDSESFPKNEFDLPFTTDLNENDMESKPQ